MEWKGCFTHQSLPKADRICPCKRRKYVAILDWSNSDFLELRRVVNEKYKHSYVQDSEDRRRVV